MTGLELLAPAGNADIGIAAIDCGADAVYIAGPQFGARQAAGNTVEELRRVCGYAHQFGARVYVTLNTIIYEDELTKALKLAEDVREAGADALIVQDLAMLQFRGLPLHASTQCAIGSSERAAFYEGMGFTRLILERQLSLEDVKKIRQSVSCELEFFVHGALCVCHSGQCYLSEAVAGRSANRGECAQSCRSRYDLVDVSGKTLVHNKALLSLKDYRLLDRLEALADAGVCSFKIEGRLKNEAYVRNVVREYSQALDALVATRSGEYRRASFGRVVKGFEPDSHKTFNRGYTRLFIDGERGKWSSMDAPKGMGEFIGRIDSVRSLSRNVMEVRLYPVDKNLSLHNGDGFSVVTDDGIVGFRGDVCEGAVVRCKYTREVAPGQAVYRNLNMAFEAAMAANPCLRLIPVDLDAQVEGLTLKIMARSEDGRRAEASITATEAARNDCRMLEIIRGQLSKSSGIFAFTLRGLDYSSSLPFLSTSQLNALRRALADSLGKRTITEFIPCGCQGTSPNIPLLSKDSDVAPNLHPENPPHGRSKQEAVLEYSYKDNIANSAAKAYLETNYVVKGLAPAYELTHPPGVELMRSKYCIKYELGLCPKHQDAAPTGPLFLVNNGRRFPLVFDCIRCEMSIL